MFGFVLWFKMINYHTYFFSPFWRKWPCLAFSFNSEKSTVWSTENWWERTCWLAAFHIQLYVLGLISLANHSSQFIAGDLINTLQKSQDCIKMLLLMGMADIFQVFQLFQTVYCLLLSMAWTGCKVILMPWQWLAQYHRYQCFSLPRVALVLFKRAADLKVHMYHLAWTDFILQVQKEVSFIDKNKNVLFC